MKKLSLFILSISLAALLQAQDFDPLGEFNLDGEKQIRIQVEWIELGHEKYTELLENPKKGFNGKLSANNQPLRDELKKLIDAKQANVVESMLLIARSGNRATVESISEFIYPTEYDPPTSETVIEGEKSRTEVAPAFGTAFELRNLGSTLEVDPVLGADNRTIDLNLAPELVYLAGKDSYGTFKDKENVVEMTMPRIYTCRLTTQVTLRDGEPLLMGVVSPRNVETMEADFTRKIMVFVKAEVLYTGLPVKKTSTKK